jgi:hypothetical protein
MLGTCVRQYRDEIAVGSLHPHCALDFAWLSADFSAPLVDHPVLVPNGLGVAVAVPHVGVAGDQAQGAALALAADQNRQPAQRRRNQLFEPTLDPRQRLGKAIEPLTGSAHRVAVLGLVLVHPTRADTEDRPPARQMVEGAGHVGQ